MPDETREGFMFFRSYYEGAKELDDEQRLAFYDALIEYALNDTEPTISGLPKTSCAALSLCLTGARRERKQAAREAKASVKQTTSKTEATRSNPEANPKP